MTEQACETPLVEMLQAVPMAHRTEWEIQWAEDGTPTGHAISPIGLLCHNAADCITELEATIWQVRRIIGRCKEIGSNESIEWMGEIEEVLGGRI